jgi:hypothetical protein
MWTDDTDAAFAAVTAKGATVLSPPHDFLSASLRAAWIADPDGNPCNSRRAARSCDAGHMRRPRCPPSG